MRVDSFSKLNHVNHYPAYFLSSGGAGVIDVGTLSKLRRLVLREQVSQREAARMLGLSRNTVKKYLEQPQIQELRYAKRKASPSVLDPYKERLATWLKADSLRDKRALRSHTGRGVYMRSVATTGNTFLLLLHCRNTGKK